MTEQTKSEKKQVSHKKKSNFFRNSVFIITVLFIAGIFLVKQIRPDLIEKIYPQAGSSGDTNVSQEFTPDSDLVKEALQEVYSFGPEPPLLSFSPEEEESEEEEMVSEIIDPYEKIITFEKSNSSLLNTRLKSNLNEYRLYLANINKLITKFEADKRYDLELQKLKKQKMPSYIEETVSLLEFYNKQLASNMATDNEVKPFDSKILAKFVKIKKLSGCTGEQKNSKEEIRESLDVLIDYIFSSDLQESFINR